ncbi:MAG: hypothetical protein V3U14_06485 [candidate division NC10 bacterium]
MGWGRIFKTLEGILSGGRTRRHTGPGSPEEYSREIQRLKQELETVRAKREKEKAEFLARHMILGKVPPEGGMPLAEVDRQLANLQRIREDRLEAEERGYERQIHELERQVQERFDPQ